jgi:carbon-monoxide dehydrogenase medium subunit
VSGFRYVRPSSLDEVLALLADGDPDTKLLAGGQSLVPIISLGLAQPNALIDLNELPGLDYARVEGDSVLIGALARHRSLECADSELAAAAPLLPRAGGLIGHAAIRNRGTFLGSLTHADPAAEWPAVALAVGAELRLVSLRGERTVAAEEFFSGPLTTVLEPDEILLEARWPVAPPRTGASVMELTYRHGDYAVVGVAAQLSLADDDLIARARLALFSVGPTPLRAIMAEEALIGRGPEAFPSAAHEAQATAQPDSDATASAAYRREMVEVYARRALAEAYARATGADVVTDDAHHRAAGTGLKAVKHLARERGRA